MAEERAGVNRLASRLRPGGVHYLCAPDARRKWKSSGQGLAQADQIGHNPAMFAGEPCTRSAKAGVNFVENQQRAVLVAEGAQPAQKLWRRNVDPSPGLHRLHEDGADGMPAEQLA